MCDLIGELEFLSRRTVLKGAVLGAGLTAVGAVVGTGTAEARTGRPEPGHDARRYDTRLILLGTAGGPTYWTDSDRAGISSAVVVGDAAYLVDCGSGAGRRYEQAGLFGEPTPPNDFTHLRGIFLTHLHSDHVSAYPELLLYGFPGDGLGTETRPVQVFGPGRRGVLPAVYPPGRPVPPPASPNLPWPGTQDMTDLLLQAFATDINDRVRDTAAPDPGTRIGVHDIPLPAGAGDDPNNIHAPRLASPLEVYEDDRVKVTATLVDHGQVFPSFAFRFDSDGGSITFSGDTTVCDNLIDLARDTDILVHEVVDPVWVDSTLARSPLTEAQRSAYRQHVIGAHTTIEQVGPVAQQAGAKALVLSHYGPGNNPRERWLGARRGFSGRFFVGEDLMQFGVGKPRR